MAQHEASARITHAQQIVIERQLDDERTPPHGMALCRTCDEFVSDNEGDWIKETEFFCYDCQDSEQDEEARREPEY